jgi:DNA-binding NarL/FixJ family response regulator
MMNMALGAHRQPLGRVLGLMTNTKNTKRSTVKILVVDDHPLILEALHHVLKQLDAQVSVFDAQSADQAQALLRAHDDADLLLLDLGLPGIDGLQILSRVRAEHPSIPVVVLSASDARENVMRAIDLGAMGFIPKSSSNQVMLGALRLVLSGGVYLPPAALMHDGGAERVPGAGVAAPSVRDSGVSARDLGLTERQAQVLGLILQGKPNKLICRELDLAEGTVKIHVAAILRALNVSTRTQAVIEASRLGLTVDSLAARAATRETRL